MDQQQSKPPQPDIPEELASRLIPHPGLRHVYEKLGSESLWEWEHTGFGWIRVGLLETVLDVLKDCPADADADKAGEFLAAAVERVRKAEMILGYADIRLVDYLSYEEPQYRLDIPAEDKDGGQENTDNAG